LIVPMHAVLPGGSPARRCVAHADRGDAAGVGVAPRDAFVAVGRQARAGHQSHGVLQTTLGQALVQVLARVERWAQIAIAYLQPGDMARALPATADNRPAQHSLWCRELCGEPVSVLMDP